MANPGILIAVEGIDGAGKSTWVRLLATALADAGEPPVVSKEPTDGPWGQKIRASAAGGRMSLDDELHAFIEDRKQHVAELIAPSLAAGRIVLLDRYFYSTIAYQGARGADVGELTQQMLALAPEPDLVLLFDVEPEAGLERISSGRGETPNEFEKLGALARVREIFLQLARQRRNIALIRAARPIADVFRDAALALCAGPLHDRLARPGRTCCDALLTPRMTELCQDAMRQQAAAQGTTPEFSG